MGRNCLQQLYDEFQASQKLLVALGDENRQHMILNMIRMYNSKGIRVGELADSSHLSRPAVSHHLQILKEAGLIKMQREGTKNYYYFPRDTAALNQLVDLLIHARELMAELPEVKEEEEYTI